MFIRCLAVYQLRNEIHILENIKNESEDGYFLYQTNNLNEQEESIVNVIK